MSKSYIMDSPNREIIEFVLKEIDKFTYFKVRYISKSYMINELHLPANNLPESLHRSISNRVGKVVKELIFLNIVEKYGKARYKNLNKGNLKKALNEQLDKYYHIIKLKQEMVY